MGQRSAFETTPMAIAALEQLLEWQVERIAATLRHTTTQIEQALGRLGLRTTSSTRGPHMLGIGLPERIRPTVAARLAAQNIHVGMRGSAMRISPHLYNTPRDIERLVGCLEQCLAD